VVYGEYVLNNLQSNVDYKHLQIAHLSDIECIDDFCFRKEDLQVLFDLLQKPLETVLEFVPGLADLVKVKHQYTVLYEAGLLMVFIGCLAPTKLDLTWKLSFCIVRPSFLVFAGRLLMHYTLYKSRSIPPLLSG
jgi:hypothetical protein